MRKADNHAGWNVEYHDNGWKVMEGPFLDREVAKTCWEGWTRLWPDTEFRVYEALATKEK